MEQVINGVVERDVIIISPSPPESQSESSSTSASSDESSCQPPNYSYIDHQENLMYQPATSSDEATQTTNMLIPSIASDSGLSSQGPSSPSVQFCGRKRSANVVSSSSTSSSGESALLKRQKQNSHSSVSLERFLALQPAFPNLVSASLGNSNERPQHIVNDIPQIAPNKGSNEVASPNEPTFSISLLRAICFAPPVAPQRSSESTGQMYKLYHKNCGIFCQHSRKLGIKASCKGQFSGPKPIPKPQQHNAAFDAFSGGPQYLSINRDFVERFAAVLHNAQLANKMYCHEKQKFNVTVQKKYLLTIASPSGLLVPEVIDIKIYLDLLRGNCTVQENLMTPLFSVEPAAKDKDNVRHVFMESDLSAFYLRWTKNSKNKSKTQIELDFQINSLPGDYLDKLIKYTGAGCTVQPNAEWLAQMAKSSPSFPLRLRIEVYKKFNYGDRIVASLTCGIIAKAPKYSWGDYWEKCYQLWNLNILQRLDWDDVVPVKAKKIKQVSLKEIDSDNELGPDGFNDDGYNAAGYDRQGDHGLDYDERPFVDDLLDDEEAIEEHYENQKLDSDQDEESNDDYGNGDELGCASVGFDDGEDGDNIWYGFSERSDVDSCDWDGDELDGENEDGWADPEGWDDEDIW